ncbi:hypothetical protein AVEN_229996-1 [Araneus ventricosus]|uniref:Uncharacterized protein n=1 Tax=Araneus ventricosus TaxID=182803 RepID=A0A4Y2TH75_ARAVE|nr:hypothetical protein AVEN_114199-1 [Araneus ventricosus]GBN99968.1 hypothetical protein AVEN_229996-1 [Araneus ventricosus]
MCEENSERHFDEMQTAHCIGLSVNSSNFRRMPPFQPVLVFVPSHTSASTSSNQPLSWLVMYSKITVVMCRARRRSDVANKLRVRFSHQGNVLFSKDACPSFILILSTIRYRLLIGSSFVERCFKFRATLSFSRLILFLSTMKANVMSLDFPEDMITAFKVA